MSDDDQYRQAVQDRVEELLSKHHSTSTSWLIVEAMVEGMKLYRSYKEQVKEEERKKGKNKEKRGHRHHKRGCCADGDEKDGHRQRHDHTDHERTDRSKDGHQHCGQPRNREHRQYRDVLHRRHRSSSRDKYNEVSLGVRHDTSRCRDDHSDYNQRGDTGNMHDSTTVAREDNHLISGANGYQTSREDLISDPRPHSVPDQVDVLDSKRMTPMSDQSRKNARKNQPKGQPQFHEHKKNPKLETKRVPVAHNAYQRGEGDDSPCRHESPVHQRHSDTRAGSGGASHLPKQQQRGSDSTPFGSLPRYKSKTGIALGFYDHFVTTYKQIKAEQDAGHRAKGYIEKVLEGARKKKPDGKTSRGKQGRDRKKHEQYPRKGEHEDNSNEDRPMHRQPHASDSLQSQDPSNGPMEEPHSPAEPGVIAGASSSIMPHALPPPLVGRNGNSTRTALLDSIQSGVRLRRVASLDKKDTSASSSAGKVLYEATQHSQEVEEREPAQAAQAAQAESETETGPEPNRTFREDLLNALEGRKARLGRTSHAA